MTRRCPRGRLFVPPASATLAAFVFATSTARALGPVEVEVAGVVGGGTNPSYAPTILGFGAGGRAGVSFHGFYLGAAGTYYAGGTERLAIGANGFEDTTHTLLLGGQAGYTFRLGVLHVRPVLELGVAELTEADSTLPAVYLQPGFAILVPLGPMFVGFDLGGLLLPSYARPCLGSGCLVEATSYVGWTFHGELGVRF